MRPSDRAVDWKMDTADVLRRVRSGDSFPGARGKLAGETFQLFGASIEPHLRGRAGHVLAQRDGAVCVATGDGAVWLSHLRSKHGIKLPAAQVLGEAKLQGVAEMPLSPFAPESEGPREILYREQGAVGYLHFDFYNGAMSTAQC